MGRPSTHSPHPPPLSSLTGAPSRRTISRWRVELRDIGDVHDPLPKGHRRPLLSEGEKRVVGGWVLQRWDNHNITSLESVAGWVYEVFQVTLSVSKVEHLMQELHLSSKAVAWK